MEYHKGIYSGYAYYCNRSIAVYFILQLSFIDCVLEHSNACECVRNTCLRPGGH